jgi:hypothetical protein
MFVYAGIDEAGYGPLLGPMVIGRSVFALPEEPCHEDGATPPALWKLLSRAVCRDLTRRKGRIAVNDSKKLHSPAAGIGHLERGVLAFAALTGRKPACVGTWLDLLGETTHRQLQALPWYDAADDCPWDALPCTLDEGEMAVTANMLADAARRAQVTVPDVGGAVVFEDRFNRMAAATRSKAATSFTFVNAHLRHIWLCFSEHAPLVVVDRQSGRMHYREPLAMAFPEAHIAVLEENNQSSAYRLSAGSRRMTVRFEVEADGGHMPVALASMIAKYTRELLMARFQRWFASRCPDIRPTAGYAQDGRRFLDEITPRLPGLSLRPEQLARIC